MRQLNHVTFSVPETASDSDNPPAQKIIDDFSFTFEPVPGRFYAISPGPTDREKAPSPI